ncbi:outer membrane lipid asymmetry maintenance protein MlaD [Vibrio sp. SS-MA-C1-2]|uniref:outer membrane lipid asymmetry maintenance protein MlaD n=1 Tax=Vibrio sp. SS-MA-C1-2 TaxID=2908646 RepID=UPI001F1DC479|nr:outer membrane lipid asymmetry maintenance protein MlaD [Vibrio sp. SS-MA-C1-2]UJF19591.1 outer membrane lipid asymmetry maintenance protein MlaD [Vibrio sp. SS-MA-C1-2]
MQQTRKSELWVGFFMIIGLLAIVLITLKMTNYQRGGSGQSYQLRAQFDNIGGLRERSPVKVGGVVVGRVSSVTLDPITHIPEITFTIDQEFGYFPETSSVTILTSGLLGEQYLGLVPGFEDDDIEMLADGDLIEDTKSAIVLEELIGQVLYSLGED